MTYQILEVAYDDPRAVALRSVLDEDLDRRYRPLHPDEPAEVAAARAAALRVAPDEVVATWIALVDETPVGHVMLRRLGAEWELKRLVVASDARGLGIGRALTQKAIARARDAGAERMILQSGPAQPESIALYAGMGFTPIPVYEPYRETMPNSLCFELRLDAPTVELAHSDDGFTVSATEWVFRIMAFSTVTPLAAYLLGFVLPILVWPFSVDITGIATGTLVAGVWGTAAALVATIVWVLRDTRIKRTSQLWVLVSLASIVPIVTLGISFRSFSPAALIGAAIIPVVSVMLGVVLSRREKNDKLGSLDVMVRRTGRDILAGGRSSAIVAVISGVYTVAVYVTVSIQIFVFPERWGTVVSSGSGVFTRRSGEVETLTVVLAAFVLGATVTWVCAAHAAARNRLRREFETSGRTLDDFAREEVIKQLASLARLQKQRAAALDVVTPKAPPRAAAELPPLTAEPRTSKRAGRGALIAGSAILVWGALNFAVAWVLGSNGAERDLRAFFVLQFLIAALVGVPVLLRVIRKGWVMVTVGLIVGVTVGGIGAIADGLNAFSVEDLLGG